MIQHVSGLEREGERGREGERERERGGGGGGKEARGREGGVMAFERGRLFVLLLSLPQ